MQISNLMSAGAAEAALATRKAMFQAADTDGDGRLTATEAEALKPPARPQGPPPGMADGMMTTLLEAQEESQAWPGAEEMFAAADADADGAVTFEELEALGARRLEAVMAARDADAAEATATIDWETLLATPTGDRQDEAV
ncbi:MAG TPA: hypothetical protein VEA44_12815 [Caulobacter sp.]|nr:hypothetical protein [Caulobacter sp.]